MEPLLTCKEVAAASGCVSERYVREMCRRPSDPIPHIRCGVTRPIYKIRMSDFERWLDEEVRR